MGLGYNKETKTFEDIEKEDDSEEVKKNRLKLMYDHLIPGIHTDDIEEITLTPAQFIDVLPESSLNGERITGAAFNIFIQLKSKEALEKWKQAK